MGMEISPIAGVGGYSMSRIEPLHYPVYNQAAVSDAYTDSVKETGSAGKVAPVGYHTARKETADLPVSRNADAIEVNQSFNRIATGFINSTVGYQQNGSGTAYSLSGSMCDAIA